MQDRFALRTPLENPDACREYATRLSKALDDRLAKEAEGH